MNVKPGLFVKKRLFRSSRNVNLEDGNKDKLNTAKIKFEGVGLDKWV